MKTSFRKILSLVLALVIISTMAGITSLAADAPIGESATVKQFATIIAPPPIGTIGLTSLNLINETNSIDKLNTEGWKYEYSLTPPENGGMPIPTGVLTLKNVTINQAAGVPAITLPIKSTIILAEGSVNTINAYGTTNTVNGNVWLDITGSGTLNINCEDSESASAAIESTFVDISSFANVNILNAYTGIKTAGAAVTIKDNATLNLNNPQIRGGCAIKSAAPFNSDKNTTISINNYATGIESPSITLNGNVTVSNASTALNSTGNISISGKANLEATVSAVAAPGPINQSSADSVLTVKGGSNAFNTPFGVEFNGTTILEQGSIVQVGGKFVNKGNFTNNASIYLNENAKLENTGTFNNNGTVTVDDNVTFTNTGTWNGSKIMFFTGDGSAPTLPTGFTTRIVKTSQLNLTKVTPDGDPANAIDKLSTEGWKWNPANGGTLELNNCSIEPKQDYNAVVLPAGASIINADGSTNLIKSNGQTSSAVYSEGSLTVGGNGTLNISSVLSGIDTSKGSITIAGGNVNIKSDWHCLYTDLGDITISGGKLTAESNIGECIYSKNNLTISGGETVLNAVDNDTVYVEKGVLIAGGKLNITSKYAGLTAYEDIVINDGTVIVNSKYASIATAKNIVISGGNVTAATTGKRYAITAGFAEKGTSLNGGITITGGTVNANGGEFGFGMVAFGNGIEVSGGTVIAQSEPTPAICSVIVASDTVTKPFTIKNIEITPNTAVIKSINTTVKSKTSSTDVAMYTFTSGGDLTFSEKTGFSGDYLTNIKFAKVTEQKPDDKPSDNQGGSDDSSESVAISGTIGGGTAAPVTPAQAADKIAAAPSGSLTVINMSQAEPTIATTIFDDIKGKDINVELNFGSFSWKFNGKNVKSIGAARAFYNMFVQQISQKNISSVAGESEIMQLELSHNGEFPCDMILTFNVGGNLSGKTIYLNYFNENTGKLEPSSIGIVDQYGNVTFIVLHASKYVVTSENVAGATYENTKSVSSSTKTTSNKSNPGTGANAAAPIIALATISLAAIGFVKHNCKKA